MAPTCWRRAAGVARCAAVCILLFAMACDERSTGGDRSPASTPKRHAVVVQKPTKAVAAAASATQPANASSASPAPREEPTESRPAPATRHVAQNAGIIGVRRAADASEHAAEPVRARKEAANASIDDLLGGALSGSSAGIAGGGSRMRRASVSHGTVGLGSLGTMGHGYGGGVGLGISGSGVGGGGTGYGYGRGAAVFNTESYARVDETSFVATTDQPLSTFSIDVDTASYTNVRRFLREGSLPPPDAVRVEEMLNYFHYRYPAPTDARPFSVHAEVANAPWSAGHRLLLVGLQARTITQEQTPPRNLVFLIDVSGSMASTDKLPLLKSGLTLLARQLREQDRIAIVVYAGASGVVLPTTHGADQATVISALDRLEAGGSTNGAEGIELAYQMARQSFIVGGVNRVVLATDGDFNVGITDLGSLTRLIEQKRESGVFLSVLGFGSGNLKDSTMEALADRGNGNYAYIDSMREAQRALVRESGGTLVTLAKDVKLQLEMNPAQVAGYRLIGYENRRLAAQDFNDDRKDAGEIGAGHSVTALYEIIPQGGQEGVPGSIDPLRYQSGAPVVNPVSDELATIKVRYKQPDATESTRFSIAVRDRGTAIDGASDNLRWAAAVAGFGMILGQSQHRGDASLPTVMRLAEGAISHDPEGDRVELLDLMRTAERLSPNPGLQVAR